MGFHTTGDVAALLTDTRALTRTDHTLRTDIAQHRYHFVAPTQVVPRPVWESLPGWQQHTLRALATGRSMTKGVLVGRSAARVMGMPVVAMSADTPEVVLPSGGTPSRTTRMPGVRYRSAGIGEDEVHDVLGVRATTPLRTSVDMARYHGFVEGLIAVDWLLRTMPITPADITWQMNRMGRCVGKSTVRRVLAYASALAESPLESWFRGELITRGITGWRIQAQIGGFRVDFLFDEFLVVEIDGRLKYAEATHEVLMKERERERALMNLGFVVLRVSFEDMLRDTDGVMRMIERARASR
ncbi:endonuclease domain-containing protein [Corynebacterium timonense]|uniref:Very-short-patch-repair endonuclease n=1 Tax=Corynebacterium timonense TaxID=441500 RepID=A0A1H1SCU7_9CORY|nr:DUF559 domain-containing protein [Corynebacterium timonense]SDS45762.1 Very-short-patch-repair endonuclease [Corynebacterium timonense]